MRVKASTAERVNLSLYQEDSIRFRFPQQGERVVEEEGGGGGGGEAESRGGGEVEETHLERGDHSGLILDVLDLDEI